LLAEQAVWMDKSKFSDKLPDGLYPKLNNEQIAQLSQLGMRRSIPAGEILFDQGTIGHHFYVVLKGAIEAVLPSSEGEVHLRLHQLRDFTGELDMLSGRRSLVRAGAADPTEVVELDSVSLRNLLELRDIKRSESPALNSYAERVHSSEYR
jgi:thioredoxin reductase (NADPH)